MSMPNEFDEVLDEVLDDKFNDIPLVEQPQELGVSLYKHQLASIYQMELRERTIRSEGSCNNKVDDEGSITKYYSNMGINADITGYGKTLTMVGLVQRNKMTWDISTPYINSIIYTFAKGKVIKEREDLYTKVDLTLVLASPSIISQWRDEFYKSSLSITTVTTKKDIEDILIDNYDVVIVSPTMFNSFTDKYHKIAWKRFIFDEPGHLAVTNMREIIAGFIWFVTATPHAIKTNYKHKRRNFMYSIFGNNSNCEDFFDSLIVKNDDEFIRSSFSMPNTKYYYHLCYNPIYKTIEGLVSPKISEMISAGNIQGVIKALGGKETDNITDLVKKKKLDDIREFEIRLSVYETDEKNADKVLE
jgi:hypothetical protein